MNESAFKRRLTDELKELFPGCEILKNDSAYFPGVPDMIILYGQKWAMLEVKRSRSANNRPNQEYWVERFDEMSFAAIIFPENKEDVLNALQSAFRPTW